MKSPKTAAAPSPATPSQNDEGTIERLYRAHKRLEDAPLACHRLRALGRLVEYASGDPFSGEEELYEALGSMIEAESAKLEEMTEAAGSEVFHLWHSMAHPGKARGAR